MSKLVCCYCNAPLDDYSKVPLDWMNNNSKTKDHLDPKSRGGILSKANKQHACFDCNSLKGPRNLNEFINAIDLLRHETVRKFKRDMAKYKRMFNNAKRLNDERTQNPKENTGRNK